MEGFALLAVTSFHPEGFRLYGERCLDGLREHFPGKVVAYYEEAPAMTGVDLRDLFGVKDVSRFLQRITTHPNSDGKANAYDFRFDASRFCRKVFAQDAVFDEDEYVFWVDADTVIKKPIPEEFLKSIFNGKHLAFCGRNTYTETGFLGFHTKHPDFAEFRARYLSYFTTGKIFGQLKGWHDCIAFDYARDGKGNNLTPRGRNYDPVIEASVLAEYLDHLKGQRKFDPTMKPRGKWK